MPCVTAAGWSAWSATWPSCATGFLPSSRCARHAAAPPCVPAWQTTRVFRMAQNEIDPTFLALPYKRLGQVALERARDFGVSHADFRFERNRYQFFSVRDGSLEGAQDTEDLGFAVRVVLDGAWGFASGVALTESEAVTIAETAVTVARVAAKMTSRPVELAPEPVHEDATWVSAYDVDPFAVPLAEKTGLFAAWTSELLAADGVDHATGSLTQVHENKYYADLGGSSITQQRVRVEPSLEV